MFAFSFRFILGLYALFGCYNYCCYLVITICCYGSETESSVLRHGPDGSEANHRHGWRIFEQGDPSGAGPRVLGFSGVALTAGGPYRTSSLEKVAFCKEWFWVQGSGH